LLPAGLAQRCNAILEPAKTGRVASVASEDELLLMVTAVVHVVAKSPTRDGAVSIIYEPSAGPKGHAADATAVA